MFVPQNSRRNFLKWLGFSSVVTSQSVFVASNFALSSPYFNNALQSKKFNSTSFQTFLANDLEGIVHYELLNANESERNEQTAAFLQSWSVLIQKIANLKNQSIVPIQKSANVFAKQSNRWTFFLSDQTEISLHLRFSTQNQSRQLTFFNGKKQSGIASGNDSEFVLKLYETRQINDRFICCPSPNTLNSASQVSSFSQFLLDLC